MLLDGSGGPPISNSVVITAGDRIGAAGPASTVPIPALADKIDGSGRFLAPAIVDIYDGPGSKVPSALHLFKKDEAEFERARDAKLAIIGHIATLADARWMVDNGATALVGAIRDTETMDPDFLAKLRDLRVVMAPALSQTGADLAVAQRNCLRMFRAGIPIALATGGGDPLREAELLSEAGIPAVDVVVAITHNGALALHLDDAGVIQVKARADLVLLAANPGEDVRNLRKVALRLRDGEVVQ